MRRLLSVEPSPRFRSPRRFAVWIASKSSFATTTRPIAPRNSPNWLALVSFSKRTARSRGRETPPPGPQSDRDWSGSMRMRSSPLWFSKPPGRLSSRGRFAAAGRKSSWRARCWAGALAAPWRPGTGSREPFALPRDRMFSRFGKRGPRPVDSTKAFMRARRLDFPAP